jgi:hypothetical protein
MQVRSTDNQRASVKADGDLLFFSQIGSQRLKRMMLKGRSPPSLRTQGRRQIIGAFFYDD